jgi:hypothetical protein
MSLALRIHEAVNPVAIPRALQQAGVDPIPAVVPDEKPEDFRLSKGQ